MAEYARHYKGEDRTARSSSSHPGPITPWPIFPRNESSAGQSSVASSTNTSELPESPGHGHRHSSGTQHPTMRTTIRHSIRVARLMEALVAERRPGRPVPPMAGTAAIGAVVHLLATAIEEGRDLSSMSGIVADTAYRQLLA